MKAVLCRPPIVIGLVSVGAMMSVPPGASAIPAAEQIGSFAPQDFVYQMGGPEPTEIINGVQIRPTTVAQMPSLEGQGAGMLLINFAPCSVNLAHVHPRATEIFYVMKGNLRVGFVEEFGGTRGTIINDVTAGDVTFFPQGLIRYQQNLGCEEVIVVGGGSSEDPGVAQVVGSFFSLPVEAIEATLNVDTTSPAVAELISGLPTAPEDARQQCLTQCGLLTSDDNGTDYGHTSTYGTGGGKRALRG